MTNPIFNVTTQFLKQLFVFRNRFFENWQNPQASDIERTEIKYSERK